MCMLTTTQGVCSTDPDQQSCGVNLYDDYVEIRHGAAREFQTLLNATTRQRPQPASTPRSSSQSSTWFTSSGPDTQIWPDGAPTGPVSGLSRPDNSPNTYASSNSSVIEIGPEGKWLLVCAELQRNPPTLCQYDVRLAKSDQDVFSALKGSYTRMKGQLMRSLSLRSVTSIKFVQVCFD